MDTDEKNRRGARSRLIATLCGGLWAAAETTVAAAADGLSAQSRAALCAEIDALMLINGVEASWDSN